MANINEERIKKFKDMGIPLPMAPVDPASVQFPVKNTEFARKLMEIRSGAKKEEISSFIEKEKAQNGFIPLEVAPKKNISGKMQQKTASETIAKPAVSGPSFDIYEKTLYGDNTPSNDTYETASNPRVNYTSDMESNPDNGSNFLADIKSRLAEKFTKAQGNVLGGLNKNINGQVIPALKENVRIQTVADGYKLINENELKETITKISSQLIKKFMSEFLTSAPGLIKESEKIKKAEIIKEDIVKIDGKFFKLTPVTLKKK